MSDVNRCKHILRRGARIGTPCGATAQANRLCAIHMKCTAAARVYRRCNHFSKKGPLQLDSKGDVKTCGVLTSSKYGRCRAHAPGPHEREDAFIAVLTDDAEAEEDRVLEAGSKAWEADEEHYMAWRANEERYKARKALEDEYAKTSRGLRCGSDFDGSDGDPQVFITSSSAYADEFGDAISAERSDEE